MKCLICKTKIKDLKENKWFPFCCEKCKMLDLYGWLNEEYFVSEPAPIGEESSDDGEI